MIQVNDRYISYVGWAHQFTNKLLHMSVFLCVIYAILNASVILKRNKKRLKRNETRGGTGNLLLSGTVGYIINSYSTSTCWI